MIVVAAESWVLVGFAGEPELEVGRQGGGARYERVICRSIKQHPACLVSCWLG